MATRLYLPSSGAAAKTPADWEFATQATGAVTYAGKLDRTTTSSGTTFTASIPTTNPEWTAIGRWVFGPLAGQTISGTLKGQMRAQQSATGANCTLGVAVKLIKAADGTDRSVLLAPTASDDTATSPPRFSATAYANRQFQDAAEATSISLTSRTATAGDYLVIEVGFRSAQTTAGRTADLRYGIPDASTDLPESTTGTTDYNPWVEFSDDLTWLSTGVYTETVTLTSNARLVASVPSTDVTVSIDGTDRTAYVREGLTIEESLGSRPVLRCEVLDTAASPSYRPAMFDELVVAEGTQTHFGGLIIGIDEEAVAPPAKGIKSIVTATGYAVYADWARANQTYAADRTDKSLKAMVVDLVNYYLASYGVALSTAATDIGSLAGPTITGEVKFDFCTVADALNHLGALTGWVWRITAEKVLRMHAPTSSATPVTLTSANATVRGAARWAKDIGQYRNQQTVQYTGGYVTVDDTTAQTAAGGLVVAHVVNAPDITDATTADTLADSLLRRYATLPKVVDVETFEDGFEAGQQGTITISQRGVSGAHLIQSCRKTLIPTRSAAYRWRTRLDAVEGNELSGSWVDLWRSMLGLGLSASSGGTVSGGFVVPIATNVAAFSACLGGSREIMVQAGTWANVPNYFDVFLDADKFSSTITARVYVKTTNASTSVTPRIWNVTDAIVAGEGTASTSTSWTLQILSVAVSPNGTEAGKEYRLQILPGDENNGVYGIGNLTV